MKEIAALFLFVAALGVLAGLTGCAGAPQIQTVKVPVPVECREQTPARPAMPTEALTRADTLDRKTAAALAEIDLREGYEGKLLAALQGCLRPVDGGSIADGQQPP
jgi:hypothetical protein